jgi:hypothetical protein
MQNPNTGGQPAYTGGPPPQAPQPKPDTVSSIFNTLHGVVHGVGAEIAGKLGSHYEPQSASHGAQTGQPGVPSAQVTTTATDNRYGSFVEPKNGNDVKWYVDGCSYMYAVSKALEGARESIWILDCRYSLKTTWVSINPSRVALARALSTKTTFEKRAIQNRQDAPSSRTARCSCQHNCLQGGKKLSHGLDCSDSDIL